MSWVSNIGKKKPSPMTVSGKIRPVQDHVLIETEEGVMEQSPGGIFIAGGMEEDKVYRYGKVVALGPGTVARTGKVVEFQCKIGDRVRFGKFAGTDVIVDDVNYKIMREKEIVYIESSEEVNQ